MDRKNKWILVGFFIIIVVLRMLFAYKYMQVWWDGSVYLGMGKYIFSFGQVGIWEPIRPLVLPFILGLGWKLGIPVLFGKMVAIVASVAAVIMTYLVAKKYCGENSALIAASLIAFFPTFFLFSFRLYTEILSVVFALMAIYFFKKDTLMLSGLFAGLATMTRFHEGIVLLILGFYSIKYGKKMVWFVIGASILIIPFLIYHLMAYGSFNYLLMASKMISIYGVWIFSQPWWYYILELVKGNFLLLFLIPGIFFFFKAKKTAIVVISLAFFVYFSILVHKEPRFFLLALPWLAIIASKGISELIKWKWLPHTVIGLSIILLFIQFPSEYNAVNPNNEEYLKFIENKDVEAEVLSFNPLVNLYSPVAVTPIYLEKESLDGASYVFVDNCEGGMICKLGDVGCEQEIQEFLDILEAKYDLAYNKELDNGCWYKVYRKS